MNFEYFINHLRQRNERVVNYGTAIRERVKEMDLSKGQHLLLPGEICKHIYFVQTGFLRLYTIVDEQEITLNFAGKNNFITSVSSFFEQQIGQEGLICESNATIFKLSFHDWRSLEELSEIFLNLSKTLLQEYLILLTQENNVFRTSNATQKYLYLCLRYPNLSNLASQKHIASYLGITEQSMSLIRKNLLRER